MTDRESEATHDPIPIVEQASLDHTLYRKYIFRTWDRNRVRHRNTGSDRCRLPSFEAKQANRPNFHDFQDRGRPLPPHRRVFWQLEQGACSDANHAALHLRRTALPLGADQ